MASKEWPDDWFATSLDDWTDGAPPVDDDVLITAAVGAPPPVAVESAPATEAGPRVDSEGRPIFDKPTWWMPPEEREFD